MNERLYKATGVVMTGLIRLLGVRIRVSGLRRLPDRPVLFVANHFTRVETFLLPYAVNRRFGKPVHSLATHAVFRGAFGRYLGAIGVTSVRDPLRNRKITGELMTGRACWVIYPEGGLVKSKRTVEKGRLLVRRAGRCAPPHTGAALMALRAEIRKDRYLEACRTDDRARRAWYEGRYDLAGPGDLAPRGAVVVPVTITYHRPRARDNLVVRVARRLVRELDPRIAEELQVEGALLFGDGETSVHFGTPIDVRSYLGGAAAIARRVLDRVRSPADDDVFLRRPARRLTDAAMRAVYAGALVNLEHLFCYGLRAIRRDVVPVRAFRQALYLAAMELRQRHEIRLHPELHDGVARLGTDDAFPPLDTVETLASAEGVLRRADGCYVIDRAALDAELDHDRVRLEKMVQVIANELEPLAPATAIVRRAVNLAPDDVETRLPGVVSASDRSAFRRDYEAWHEPGVSKPARYGEPFFLERPGATTGVVLVHGYLAAPEQMRPLAEYLHAGGCSVYAVRLDGHGTSPRQLAGVRWEGWLESVAHGCSVIEHACPRLVVGGFSLGGILAAILAARRPETVAGLLLVNAPIRLRHPLVPLVPAALRVNRVLRMVDRTRGALRRENPSESPDINYDVDYLAGVRELRAAIRVCRRGLPRVTAPTVIVQSDRDPVVAPRSAEVLHARLGSEHKTIVRVPARRHVIVRGEHRAAVFDAARTLVDEVSAPAPPTGKRRPRLPGERGTGGEGTTSVRRAAAGR